MHVFLTQIFLTTDLLRITNSRTFLVISNCVQKVQSKVPNTGFCKKKVSIKFYSNSGWGRGVRGKELQTCWRLLSWSNVWILSEKALVTSEWKKTTFIYTPLKTKKQKKNNRCAREPITSWLMNIKANRPSASTKTAVATTVNDNN